MRRWLRWLPFPVVLCEAVLVATGVLSLARAALAFLAVELLLAGVVVAEAAVLLRTYRAVRRDAGTRSAAWSAAVDAVLPPPVAFLARQEFRVFGAVASALVRRRAVRPGEAVVSYGGNLRILLVGMVVVSIVEMSVVELLVPWAWLRWVLVVVGAYGLLWVLGFGCSLYTRPHTVGGGALRLRFAIFTAVTVPLASGDTVTESLVGTHRKLVEVTEGTLALSVMGTTNVLLRLAEPVELDLGRRGRHRVERVRFYADDPKRAAGLVSAAATAPADAVG